MLHSNSKGTNLPFHGPCALRFLDASLNLARPKRVSGHRVSAGCQALDLPPCCLLAEAKHTTLPPPRRGVGENWRQPFHVCKSCRSTFRHFLNSEIVPNCVMFPQYCLTSKAELSNRLTFHSFCFKSGNAFAWGTPKFSEPGVTLKFCSLAQNFPNQKPPPRSRTQREQ